MLDKPHTINSIENWCKILGRNFEDQEGFSEDFFTPKTYKHSHRHRYVTRQENLDACKERQDKKSDEWSLFHRRKDFVVAGVEELRELGQKIWPEEKNINQKLVTYLQNHSRFPLVNEECGIEKLFNNKAEETTKNTGKWSTHGDFIKARVES